MKTKKETVFNQKTVFTRIYKEDLERMTELLPKMRNADRIRSLYNYSLFNIENKLRNFNKKTK